MQAADAIWTSADELWRWQTELDALGPRLPGSTAHEAFSDQIADRLQAFGFRVESDVHAFDLWQPGSWRLDLPDGGTIPCSVFPYSGQTPDGGVTARLVRCRSRRDLARARGAIALVEVDMPAIPTRLLFRRRTSVPADLRLPGRIRNAVIASVLKAPDLRRAAAQGVLGVVCIWKGMSAENARDQYLPFTTPYQGCPAVWADVEARDRLIAHADAGGMVTLTLRAERRPATSRTLWTVLEGREAGQTVVINTHTDGPNACEENGPIGLIALARYFRSRPHPPRRSMVFVFTTGHFQIPQFGIGHRQATSRWLDDHRDWWDGAEGHRKAVAGITLEHLGCMDWQDGPEGFVPTGEIAPELVYAGNTQLARLYQDCVSGRTRTRSIILRPHNRQHFGEGQPLFQVGIPALALIPAPDYLCRIGDVLPQLDARLMLEQLNTFREVLDRLDQLNDPAPVQSQSWGL